MRHDEREAIALIRESNRNIYEQPDRGRPDRRLGLPQLVIPRDRAARRALRSSRERFRCNREFATFGVT